MISPDREQFLRDGFQIIDSGLDEVLLNRMIDESARLQQLHARSRAGVRDPLGQSEYFSEIEQPLRPIACRLLGAQGCAVRSILFDKTPDSNWDVIWHQDVTIAVKEKKEVPGFGPWSVKIGLPHVQPRAEVLANMVTLRLHLDDCPKENGALMVIPGSHRIGFIDVKTLDTHACDEQATICAVTRGQIVAMCPLTLHASKKSLQPGHRRVLHIEYAAGDLPGGLEWA